MKKGLRILSLLLSCVLCVGLFAACSGGNDVSADTTPADTTTADTTTPPEDEKWPQVEGTVIYVDTATDDNGDGTKENPFKSIPEAQAKIREIKTSDGLPEGGITVLLASGEYKVTETISFNEEDSGTAESPIRYMSAEKNGAVLTGGISIPASEFSPLSEEEKALINDEAAKDKVLKIDLTRYGISGTGYDFFINGERLYLSRYPNVSVEDPYLRTGENDKTTNFKILAISEFEEQAVAIKERGKNWDINTLRTGGYLGATYSFEIHTVKELDLETLSVVLNTKPYYGIGLLDSFYFDNIFAETDEFGEYYLAGNSMTLYICPPEDFADGCLEISLLSSNFISGNNLSYVSFDGINFTLGKGNGLVLTGNNLTVENCELSKINGDAIYVNGSDITVQNNVIYQIGANAVAAYGGVVETLTPANILVYNNLMYKWAQVRRTYKCAVRLEGCGITASHNEMYDAPHEAIEYIGPNNLIEYNIIHDVCLETHDCGAIYAMRSFDQYGTVLRYNIIYDIGGKFGSGMGIYWDDGLSGQTMYGNIIANTPYSCSMNIGGGRDNVIENNLFISWAYDEYSIFFDNRAREYADEIGGGQEKQTVEMAERLAELQKQQEWLDAFPGYEDIIPYTYNYAGDRDDLYLSCNAAHNTVRNNIACQVRAVASSKYYFAEWISEEDLQGTYENNMAIHDPDHTFIPGYENNDFTIAEDSEVYSNGFVRIPVEEIGRVTND